MSENAEPVTVIQRRGQIDLDDAAVERALNELDLKPRRYKGDSRTQQRKARFLVMFSRVANIVLASRVAGINYSRHYRWLRSDAKYRADFEFVRELGIHELEKEAWKRALGWSEPQFIHGKQVGTITRFSDALLCCLLKAYRPEKYGGRIDAPAPEPMATVINLDFGDGPADNGST